MIEISKEHANFITKHGDEILKRMPGNSDKYGNFDRFENSEVIYWFCEILSLYLSNKVEIYVSPYVHASELNEDYRVRINLEILNEINNQRPTRSKVTGKYFNYLTNVYEYELENGDFIPVSPQKKYKSTFDISGFPLEYIKIIDAALYRSLTIQNIIK